MHKKLFHSITSLILIFTTFLFPSITTAIPLSDKLAPPGITQGMGSGRRVLFVDLTGNVHKKGKSIADTLGELELDVVYLPMNVTFDTLDEIMIQARNNEVDVIHVHTANPRDRRLVEDLIYFAHKKNGIPVFFTENKDNIEHEEYPEVETPKNLGRIEKATQERAKKRRFRYVVLGAGIQGAAVAFDLAQQEDTREIVLIDKEVDRARALKNTLKKNRKFRHGSIKVIEADLRNPDAELEKLFARSDVVIGAADYSLNARLSQVCAENGAHFVDMGGNTDVVLEEFKNAETAIKNGCAIIPDLGLAPGLAGHLAVNGIERLDEVDNVEMRVGGIPISDWDRQRLRELSEEVAKSDPALSKMRKKIADAPNTALHNPLMYLLVFSIYGLINEYMGDTLAIRNGKVVAIPTITERESIRLDDAGPDQLEAFPTFGGISVLPHTYAGRVKNMDNKTIRYAGHGPIIEAFIKMGFFDDNTSIDVVNNEIVPKKFFEDVAANNKCGELLDRDDVKEAADFLGLFNPAAVEVVGNTITPRRFFAYLADKALETIGEKDKILINVHVTGKKDGKPKSINYSYNPFDAGTYGSQYSEMARLTAFPVSIVATMLARRQIQYVGAAGPEHFVPTDLLIDELRKRGINIRVEEDDEQDLWERTARKPGKLAMKIKAAQIMERTALAENYPPIEDSL